MTGDSLPVLPGGVNSPVRAWGAVGGRPPLVASAAGSRVRDAAGLEYVDLVCSWGAAIVGHAHPAVTAAVVAAAERGLGYGATTAAEIELAEQIRSRYAPAERVRLVSTGTEATMTAVRVARAATGRDVIVKFSGCYHGHSDGLLAEAGSGVATAGIPGSAGVPGAVAALTIVVPYGDLDALDAVFAQRGDEIAAVITEGAPANMGVVHPPPGFNAGVAAACRRAGALFILDEVLTGFRAGPRGWWGIENDAAASAGDAWRPDLVTFGKVIGGGLPVAALAGDAALMGMLAPEGDVYQAGTLSGNPVAVAAGLATLGALDAEWAGFARAADRLATGLAQALAGVGTVATAGTLASPFLGLESPPRDYATARRQDAAAYARLFQHLHRRGIWAPPSGFEAWFVSAAHTDADVDLVLEAVAEWRASEAHA